MTDYAACFATSDPGKVLLETEPQDASDIDLDVARAICHNLDKNGQRQLALTPGEEKNDNDLRAAWGFLGLDAYVRRVSPGGDDFDGMLGDLFTDLMHLCNAVGVNPDDAVEKATRRYTEELYGEV